jgi:hypothetical protein
MSQWKLYWLSIPYDETENCFVIAHNKRDAVRLEDESLGWEPGDVHAAYVADIPEPLEQQAIEAHRVWVREQGLEQSGLTRDHPWPGYAREWLLLALGATFRRVMGRNVTILNGRAFTELSYEESYEKKPPR